MLFKQMQYFISIVKNNSFTEAAEENYISQSAISQAIKSLEDELGVELLKRSNRSFTLTSAGEYFYKQSLIMVDEVDDVYDDISEGMFIRTKSEEIIISYPGVENGKLEYGYLERKQKPDGIKTSSYVIREDSLVIKQHIGGFRTINMTGKKDFFALSKKAPQILELLNERNDFDPLDMIPKIRGILGCSLKDFEKFRIDNECLLIESGKIVELGERTDEYSVSYSADRFWYRDKYYDIRLMPKDEIEISVTGKYKELKNVSISDIRKIADKKRKEMKEKVEKLSTEI